MELKRLVSLLLTVLVLSSGFRLSGAGDIADRQLLSNLSFTYDVTADGLLCTGSCTVESGYTARLSLTLECSSDGSHWYWLRTLQAWSNHDGLHEESITTPIENGRLYRLVISAEAYPSAANNSEPIGADYALDIETLTTILEL